MELTDKFLIRVITIYKGLCKDQKYPLENFINLFKISDKTVLLWLKTRISIETFSLQAFKMPIDKDQFLSKIDLGYKVLNILYNNYKITLIEIIGYLQRNTILSREDFIELLTNITSPLFLNELKDDSNIPPQIKELIKKLREGNLVTVYDRKKYNMTQQREYEILYHFLWN